ncbi:MAG: hypothetical protein ND866_01355 [Pyrinomonadaceae bacterium]|nr:hypothetical protein [Pyrinomonadaceae bacterium]
MNCKNSLLVAAFLLGSCSLALPQAERPLTPVRLLRNGDVIRMHKDGVKPDEIIVTIWISECRFDIFPQVLLDLERRGIPDSVLLAMTLAPYGPTATAPVSSPKPAPQTVKIQIPAGTVIEVEIASRVSSADVNRGSRLTFRVSRRVFVNGVLAINRGAIARARVLERKRAKSWGRAGTIDWIMEDVDAVDGTRVPIELLGHVKGTNHRAAVVAAAIVTGAIVFPYSPPAGLIWGLKKGDEAVLYASSKSTAKVSDNTEVGGLLPEEKKVILHSVDKLKAADAQSAAGLPAFNKRFRPTPIRQP